MFGFDCMKGDEHRLAVKVRCCNKTYKIFCTDNAQLVQIAEMLEAMATQKPPPAS